MQNARALRLAVPVSVGGIGECGERARQQTQRRRYSRDKREYDILFHPCRHLYIPFFNYNSKTPECQYPKFSIPFKFGRALDL
jgi:hypothetical protein